MDYSNRLLGAATDLLEFFLGYGSISSESSQLYFWVELAVAEPAVERVYLAKARREGRKIAFIREFDKFIFMVDFNIIRIIIILIGIKGH